MMNRPRGSNADEWNLFLCEHLGPMNNGSPYVAVQIAEAIEAAREVHLRASHDRLLAAVKEAIEDQAITRWNMPERYYDAIMDAIAKAEQV